MIVFSNTPQKQRNMLINSGACVNNPHSTRLHKATWQFNVTSYKNNMLSIHFWSITAFANIFHKELSALIREMT